MVSRSRIFAPTGLKMRGSFCVLRCLVNADLAYEDSGLPPRQASEKSFSSLYHNEMWMSKQQLVVPASKGEDSPAPQAMKSKQGNQRNDGFTYFLVH